MSRKKYLFLLLLTLISPILCGLLWGKIWILIYSILIVLLALWASSKKWFMYVMGAIIFISAADAMLNFYNRYRINQQTLFVETDVPLVKKYKANSVLKVDYYDGADESKAKKYPMQITIDALGYRNNKHTQDSCDVLLLGDSFGVGNAVQDSIISELMYSDHKLNTYNLSVSGNGPWEQSILLKKELKKIKLKKNATVVWLIFSGNDLEGNFGPLENLEDLNSFSKKMERFRDEYFTFRSQSPLRNIFSTTSRESESKNVLGFGDISFYPNYIKELKEVLCCSCKLEDHPHIEQFKNTIQSTIAYLKSQNISLQIYLLPAKEEVYEWMLDDKKEWTSDTCESPLSRVICNISFADKISCFDLKSLLIEKSKQEKNLIYWNYDTHLNHEGNKILSDIISENIRR